VSVSRAAAGMGVATAISRGFGFVRVLVVAAVLGTTYLGNTFQAANSTSNVLFELLAAGALSAVLVPTFVSLLDQGGDDEANRLAGGLLWVALCGLGAVTVAGVVGAPLIARVLTANVDDPAIATEQRELATFLLRFFVPQVLLYAYGTVATAWLYARRRFAITALAPIGNTVVIVAALVAFRVAAGPEPGLDLSSGERMLLVVAGTGGVIAYVATLVGAAARTGFRLWPRRPRRDPALGRLLRLAAWGVLLHANAGLLLSAALVFGNGVAGGVVAYQVAFVFFLAPYAVLAQPIHTAVLPELARQAAHGDTSAFASTVRWALDRMTVLVVPVAAAMAALALPAMRVVAFGEARAQGPGLIAAALVGLAFGLLPYGALLLLARAYYALGDSRTPAVVAIVSALVGVATMAGLALATQGQARVAALGIGHSVAYLVGAAALAFSLARRLGRPIVARMLPASLSAAGLLACMAWAATETVDPRGRAASLGWLAAVGAVGGVAYVAVVRRGWRRAAGVGVAS